MLPTTSIELDEAGKAKSVLRVIDALEEHDDVQNVYANFDVPDEILSAVYAWAHLLPSTHGHRRRARLRPPAPPGGHAHVSPRWLAADVAGDVQRRLAGRRRREHARDRAEGEEFAA